MRAGLIVIAGMLVWAGAAAAQDRELCPSLSGLDTGPCILDAGRVIVESNLADFTRDRQPDETTDTLIVAHSLLRLGIGGSTEAQLEWTPYGHVRTRDRATGEAMREGGVGDVTLGVRQSLRNPDGSGFSIAVQPSVSVPVGRTPVGAGDWGAMLIVPMSIELGDVFTLTLSPEVDAEVDEDGDGRHLAYGGVASIGAKLSDAVQVQLDYAGFRDRDPEGHATVHRISSTLSWQPDKDLAVFLSGVGALDHDAPDAQLWIGVARRF